MSSDKISVISVQEITGDEEIEGNSQKEEEKNDGIFTLKNMFEALGTSGFGVIGFSLLFTVPWTSIPRTDSIIYQSHWMEVLIPSSSLIFLATGSQLLDLATWTQETTLMTIQNYLKISSIYLIPFAFLYIALSVLWSVYLQYNHPLPFLLTLSYLPTIMITAIGLWFILPPHLLARTDFRQKLKMYTFILLWRLITITIKEILSSLFINPPGGLQFLVPFLVAGCRELDKRVKWNLIKKMMGKQDEAARALLEIGIGTSYSMYIAIKLV